MKKTVFYLLFSIFLYGYGQTDISTIEDFNLPADSFYNASSGGSGFQSGNVLYPTIYDNSFQIWSSGFAASNMKDSSTSGYNNLYSAKAAGGCLGSFNYAVGQNYAVAKFMGSSQQDSVLGFYLTNTTYAYNSMRYGDAFAKKFGGLSGNDPDWFLLTVKKYFNGVLYNDSVYFYLADYRYSNNANDYILDSWQWVNCKSLGKADSLLFVLSSSDTGQFGMNTPGFFAIDNLTTKATFVGIHERSQTGFKVYPIPATDEITIENENFVFNDFHVRLYDLSGGLILEKILVGNRFKVDLNNVARGNYLLKINFGSGELVKRVIKQ